MGNFNSVTTHGSAMNKDKVELVAEGEKVPNPTSMSTSGSGVASASAVKVKLEIDAYNEETLHDEIEVDANEADASAVGTGTENTTTVDTASSNESTSDESALKATANVNATIETMKQYKYNTVREKLVKLRNLHKSYGLMKCWGIAAIELSQIDGVLCNILEDHKAKLLQAYKIGMGSHRTSNSIAVAAPDLNTVTEQSVSEQYKAVLEKLDSIHEMHMTESALHTSTDASFSNDIATYEMNTIHDRLCRIIEDRGVKMQQQYCDVVDMTDDKTSDEESVNFDTKPPSKKRCKTEQLGAKPDSRTLSRGKYTPHGVEEATTTALEQRNTTMSVSDHRLATTSLAIKGEASKASARADGVSMKKNAVSGMRKFLAPYKCVCCNKKMPSLFHVLEADECYNYKTNRPIFRVKGRHHGGSRPKEKPWETHAEKRIYPIAHSSNLLKYTPLGVEEGSAENAAFFLFLMPTHIFINCYLHKYDPAEVQGAFNSLLDSFRMQLGAEPPMATVGEKASFVLAALFSCFQELNKTSNKSSQKAQDVFGNTYKKGGSRREALDNILTSTDAAQWKKRANAVAMEVFDQIAGSKIDWFSVEGKGNEEALADALAQTLYGNIKGDPLLQHINGNVMRKAQAEAKKAVDVAAKNIAYTINMHLEDVLLCFEEFKSIYEHKATNILPNGR